VTLNMIRSVGSAWQACVLPEGLDGPTHAEGGGGSVSNDEASRERGWRDFFFFEIMKLQR
jgi:hypothetical protein